MTLKTITASIALLGIAATTALAADAAPPADQTTSAGSELSQTRRAVRDSETGKLRAPSEDELAAIRAARGARGIAEPSGHKVPLAVRQYSNGMRGAVLGPDFLVTLKAERTADGRLVVKHADPAHDHPSVSQHQQRPTE